MVQSELLGSHIGRQYYQAGHLHYGPWKFQASHDARSTPPVQYMYTGSADQDRFQSDDIQRRAPPMSIQEALPRHCGIMGQLYFVAIIAEDDTIRTYLGPRSDSATDTISTFFDETIFRMASIGSGEAGRSSVTNKFHSFEHNIPRRRVKRPDQERTSNQQRSLEYKEWRRSKPRPKLRRDNNSEAGERRLKAWFKKPLLIGNSDTVRSYYYSAFVALQQNACKIIAKAWIRLFSPKKQSTHPYTNGDDSAPDWWPKPWGSGKGERVRHTEPDHISKPERIHLLIHMLMMVVETNDLQHESIRHMGFNVKRLDDCATKALAAHFAQQEEKDRVKDRDRERKLGCDWLKELFQVAKLEEQFKDGEVDHTTKVYVTAPFEPGNVLEKNFSSGSHDEAHLKTEEQKEAYLAPGPALCAPTVGQTFAQQLPRQSSLGGLQMRGFTPPNVPGLPHQHSAIVESNAVLPRGLPAANASVAATALDFGSNPHGSRRQFAVDDYSKYVGDNRIHPSQWLSRSAIGSDTAAVQNYVTQSENGYPDTSVITQGIPMSSNLPHFTAGPADAPRSGHERCLFRFVDQPTMSNLRHHHHQG